MIAFNLNVIRDLTRGNKKLYEVRDTSKLTQILSIEFLGGRLSSCSSIQYLNGLGGHVYFSSRCGDSYILRIESEKQPE
jgi:hypothetical protein